MCTPFFIFRYLYQSRVLWALYFLFAENLPSVNDVNVYHLRSPTSNSLTSLFLSPFPFYVVLVFMVVIGISVAFFDTFYCVVAWEAITNVAVVDSKRTLDLYLLKVRVVIYCILSLPKVLLDCCNKYFIVFCHVTLGKLPSYYSYYIKFQIFS